MRSEEQLRGPACGLDVDRKGGGPRYRLCTVNRRESSEARCLKRRRVGRTPQFERFAREERVSPLPFETSFQSQPANTRNRSRDKGGLAHNSAVSYSSTRCDTAGRVSKEREETSIRDVWFVVSRGMLARSIRSSVPTTGRTSSCRRAADSFERTDAVRNNRPVSEIEHRSCEHPRRILFS